MDEREPGMASVMVRVTSSQLPPLRHACSIPAETCSTKLCTVVLKGSSILWPSIAGTIVTQQQVDVFGHLAPTGQRAMLTRREFRGRARRHGRYRGVIGPPCENRTALEA